jgi:hypothetical protein
MKTIINIKKVLKTIIITGVIAVLTNIPTFADSQPSTQQDKQIIDHYTMENGDMKTVYNDNSYVINADVIIQSNSYINNSLTIEKNNNLYKFYVDEPRNYYLGETINITMDNKDQIIDCTVDSEPQVYTTQISQIEGNEAFLIANGNKYSFENEEGQDGWKTGEKCKAIIQDGRLLEVRPIPLNER